MDHKFIEQLRQSRGEAAPLTRALADFSTPKELTVQNFKAGVQRFIELANMHPDARLTFYGNRYAGLYNNNHLAELWNTTCKTAADIIAPHDLDGIAPSDWGITGGDTSISLKYTNSTPAAALYELLRGPTVIDCGIFCQLGIWFGLLYVLGEERFNMEFGSQPFWLTRSNFEAPQAGVESNGNPLFSFFTVFAQNSVSIEHVFNDIANRIKHPGSTQDGENCLVIDNVYYTFAPLSLRNGFTRAEVVQELLDAFNAEPDSNDAEALKVFNRKPKFFEHRYGSMYKFEFSAEIWFKLLFCNRPILEAYANIMDNIPECKQKMVELFGHNGQDSGKAEFIASFSDEDQQNNQDKYEIFFSTPLVNDTFQQLLKINPSLFQAYYKGILRAFTQCHQAYATVTLSQQKYIERLSARELSIPSHIHFDFNTFLASLSIGHGLSPIPTSTKRVRTDADNLAGVGANFGDLRFIFMSSPSTSNTNEVTAGENRTPGLALGGADS